MPRSKPKPRPALALAPTVRRIDEGRDAYLTPTALRALTRGAKRYWTFHGIPSTVEMSGRRYAKNVLAFGDHQDEDALAELVREYASHGVPRPSGYADVFHALYKSPRVPWSINQELSPAFAGGWQEAIRVGVSPGAHYKYDMRSAYLWAGTLGMPDPRSYRRVTSVRRDRSGVYVLDLTAPVAGAPFPFNRATRVLATDEEIDLYGLPVARVIVGCTWTRTLDPSPMLAAIRQVSSWKQAGRSYWGRWGQTERVTCHVGSREWTLPSFASNVPWAATIVARVKARVWTHASRAVHVFVDSIITPDASVPVGPALGDWKLEKVYTSGVFVRAPGWYGEPGKRLDRAAGIPQASPLRDRWADASPELLAG